MILTYPTTSTAYTVQRWGNVNYKMYPGGRHMGIDIGGPMVGALEVDIPSVPPTTPPSPDSIVTKQRLIISIADGKAQVESYEEL